MTAEDLKPGCMCVLTDAVGLHVKRIALCLSVCKRVMSYKEHWIEAMWLLGDEIRETTYRPKTVLGFEVP